MGLIRRFCITGAIIETRCLYGATLPKTARALGFRNLRFYIVSEVWFGFLERPLLVEIERSVAEKALQLILKNDYKQLKRLGL